MSVQPIAATVFSGNDAVDNTFVTEHRFIADDAQWFNIYQWTSSLNLVHGAAVSTFRNSAEGRTGDCALGSVISYLSRNMDLMGKAPASAVGHKMNEMMSWGKNGVEVPNEHAAQHIFLSGSDFKIVGNKVHVFRIGELPLTLDPVSAELKPVMIELFHAPKPIFDHVEHETVLRVHYDRVCEFPTNVIPLVRL